MKFLIVDDDLAMCQIITFYLASHGRCFTAATSSQAMQLFTHHVKTEPFQAIFMDIEMPGFNGHDLVELFRITEQNFNIPKEKRFKLVMVSAHADLNNLNTSLYTNKAKCFIKKPFTEEEFIRELKDARVLPL